MHVRCPFNSRSMSTWVADSLGLMNKAAVNMTCILAVHPEHMRLAVKVTALPAVQRVPDRAYSRYTPASAVCGLWMRPSLAVPGVTCFFMVVFWRAWTATLVQDSSH